MECLRHEYGDRGQRSRPAVLCKSYRPKGLGVRPRLGAKAALQLVWAYAPLPRSHDRGPIEATQAVNGDGSMARERRSGATTIGKERRWKRAEVRPHVDSYTLKLESPPKLAGSGGLSSCGALEARTLTPDRFPWLYTVGPVVSTFPRTAEGLAYGELCRDAFAF